MEKSQVETNVSDIDSEQEHHNVKAVSTWLPGYWKRFPYVGAIALMIMAILACAALAVLCISNNMSSSKWPQRIAPNVVLSILNSFSTLALTIAVGEGVAISWWRHAMKGSTVKELHHEWELSTGILSLLYKPRSLLTSTIALAVLATQITLINSILYQRAASTYSMHDPPKTMSAIGIAAQEFPMTGYVVSNTSFGAQTSCACFMIGDSFTPVVNTWETSNGFWAGYNELFRFSKRSILGKTDSYNYCDGVCYTSIQAIGFEIDCNDQANHTDIAIAPINAYNAKGDPSAWTNVPIFNSSFGLEYASASQNYSQITLDLEYFQSDDPYNPKSTTCPGNMYSRKCTLRPAIVQYPIKIMNMTNEHVINGVSLSVNEGGNSDPMMNVQAAPPKYDKHLKQAAGFSVVEYLYPADSHLIGALTALGGIANAFSQFLASSAAITYQGDSWSLEQKGTLAQTMMYGPPNMGSCDCSFRDDSLDVIVAGINQLTFLTATGMVQTDSFRGLPRGQQTFPSTLPQATVAAVSSNTTTTFRQLQGQTVQLTDVVHYQTHFVYGGIAFAVTILCILLVIPSFWQYGELGRRVTLGPVEIASAFGAPILTDSQRDEARHETIDTLIKHIGDRKIVYGFVDVDGDGIIDDHQEMHLAGQNRPGMPVPESPNPNNAQRKSQEQAQSQAQASGTNTPMMSPVLGQGESPAGKVQKRRSVRLAFSAPEQVTPTSQVFPAPQRTPTLPLVEEGT